MDTAFLILWLVIESLFGPEDAREITFRLSQRLALFMGTDSEETRALFRKRRRAMIGARRLSTAYVLRN